MMIQRINILLFFFVAAVTGLQAQKTTNDCRAVFEKMFETQETLVNNPQSGISHYECTYSVVLPKGSEKDKYTTTFTMTFYRKKSIYLSDNLELYRDSLYTIAVFLLNKEIFLYPSDFKANENVMAVFYTYKDSILKNSTVVNCHSSVSNTGTPVKYIDMRFSGVAAKLVGSQRAELGIDLTLNEVVSLRVKDIKNDLFTELLFTVEKIDHNYKTSLLSIPLEANIYKGKGVLKDKYKGFTVIDKRK